MQFSATENRAWVRLQSHTVVIERDPDFLRFEKDPAGTIMRMIRIWGGGGRCAYSGQRRFLGSLRVGMGPLRREELMRLYRQSSRRNAESERTRSDIRCELSRFLRRYISRPQETEPPAVELEFRQGR